MLAAFSHDHQASTSLFDVAPYILQFLGVKWQSRTSQQQQVTLLQSLKCQLGLVYLALNSGSADIQTNNCQAQDIQALGEHLTYLIPGLEFLDDLLVALVWIEQFFLGGIEQHLSTINSMIHLPPISSRLFQTFSPQTLF